MKFTKLKAAGIAAGVALMAVAGNVPAQAHSIVPLVEDAGGVEWDPACILDLPVPWQVTPSPGASPCNVTTWDGSAESVDLKDGGHTLLYADGVLVLAAWEVDGQIPAAGSAFPGVYDGAAANYVGGSYWMFFQNPLTQTNERLNFKPKYASGCTGHAGQPVFDQQGSWKDGYHKFIYFHFNIVPTINGPLWHHSAGVGTYIPDGGLATQEVAVADGLGDADGDGSDWDALDPNGPNYTITVGPLQVSVSVSAMVTSSNPDDCAAPGVFTEAFAVEGDPIINIKALTTSDAVLQFPVTIPTSTTCDVNPPEDPPGVPDPCMSDINGIGGFVFWTDQTLGTSTAGLAGCNPTGTSFTRACQGTASAYVLDQDTLGDGPTCPTPTVGGTLPMNPLFTPDQACQIDDDNIARGTILAEFWETPYNGVM